MASQVADRTTGANIWERWQAMWQIELERTFYQKRNQTESTYLLYFICRVF